MKRRAKSPRPSPSPKKLLKRPVEDAAELERLTAWVAGRRERFAARLPAWLAVAGVVVVVNLATTAFRAGVDPAGRFFSLIVFLAMAVLLVPAAVRKLRTHPRIVAAQRLLLGHRGLVAGAGTEALGDEVERLVKRMRQRLAALGRDDAAVADVERRARALRERLAAAEEQAATGRRDRGERLRLRACLEAFRVTLADMEVEALLRRSARDSQSGFHDGTAARDALLDAAALLDGGAPEGAAARPEAAASGILMPPRSLLGGVGGKAGSPPRPELSAPLSSPGPLPSIAVLPFADLSPEQDQEYFCHGLAEELIHALTHIRDLRVIARASSFSLLDERHDVRAIGRALGVDTLVDGSVRKAGHRLRVTVQLIRTADGHHLWSERYDRDAGDVFAIQDEITAALVEHLHLELKGDAARQRHRKVDLEAYHLYLKARHLWNKRSPTELRRSADLFHQAIARDPRYALAHAGLADAYDLLGFYSVLAPHEAFPRAITAASQALDVDADLAEAHASLAFAALLYQWDWAGAGESFRRALELNPGYTTAHHWYAEYLGLMGRHEEALRQARLAYDLDPLSPIIHTLLGWVFYYGRRYDEAIAALSRTLELEAGFAPAEFWLAMARAEKGQLDDALDAMGRALDHSNRSTLMLAASGRLKAVAGEPDEARAVLGELEDLGRTSYVPAYYCAAIHAACGEVEETFGCLARAVEERDNWLVFLRVDPLWDDLRGDSRFAELLRKVGFE